MLPESVEHIEVVQQVAGVLEELQKRVLDVKEEASKELKKLMKRYETNYKGLEKKVHSATLEAKKQAQTSMIQLLQKWHEHKDKLPKPLAKEIEKIIDQIGAKVVAKAAKKPRKKTNPPAKRTGSKTMKTKSPLSKKAMAVKTVPAKSEVLNLPHSEAKL
jgi:type VI protein secretion system component VasK